ncbi:MAG: hypothetical protein N2321_01230 [Melioribacteraceae bacterium]|nr:hypothetical protein [Melioribacteraceae bacterium]
MKRLIYISLLIIYLIPTIGVSLSYHFCGDFVQSVNLDYTAKSKEPSDCCGENENDGCCHNEVKIFKLNDYHSPVYKADLFFDNIIETTLTTIIEEKTSSDSFTDISTYNFPPGKKITIQNHLLLI